MRRLTTLFLSEFLGERAKELGVVEHEENLQLSVLGWHSCSAVAQTRAEH